MSQKNPNRIHTGPVNHMRSGPFMLKSNGISIYMGLVDYNLTKCLTVGSGEEKPGSLALPKVEAASPGSPAQSSKRRNWPPI